MSLLPESGKPIDLDRSQIVTTQDADAVLAWLDALIVDMQHQILQHLTNSQLDLDWLAKVRSALRATIKTRFLVAEQKRDMLLDREELFIDLAQAELGAEKTENLWGEVEKRLQARTS